jgi:Anticodon binding domain
VSLTADELARAMQRWGVLEDPVPEAADRWIDTFLRAYGQGVTTPEEARPLIAALRAEACQIPALELERLRSRDVLFFIDSVGQYVDHQPELRDLPLDHDLAAIADEFGLSHDDARFAVRMALTGTTDGPPLELLFPLLGHDRILIRIGAVNSKLLHGRGLKPIERGPGGAPFSPIRGSVPESAGRNPAVDEPG